MKVCKALKYKIFIVFCILYHISCFPQNGIDNWQLKKNEDGITVYTRKSDNSDFKELKAVLQVKTSLSSIVALINDWDSYPQWVYKCGQSSTLKKISETELIHYQTIISPWPADNRDFVVNVKLTQNEKSRVVIIRSTSYPDHIPPVEDYVRIRKLNASWTLVPLKGGTVEVTYQLLVDPAGNIPAWLVNMAIVSGPFETMLNFKEWVMKKKYQDAKISFIKELN